MIIVLFIQVFLKSVVKQIMTGRYQAERLNGLIIIQQIFINLEKNHMMQKC